MSREDRIFITPEEAERLLPDGEYVHNIVGGGGIILGCDYSRQGAIDAFKEAEKIEIGGEQCQQMRHPIVVFEKGGIHTFFEADMDKFYETYPDEKAA